jgi:hypothetical protein
VAKIKRGKEMSENHDLEIYLAIGKLEWFGAIQE